MSLRNSLTFLKRYLAAPATTGAIAPSSRRLARVLATPFLERTKPAKVLEVGAGTGSVTRVLAADVREGDELHICEIQSALADVIERDVLDAPELAEARRAGRIKMIRGAVEEVDEPHAYDFIVCGLPFTAFEPQDVRRIMRVIAANLKSDGVFSYFEYRGLRRLACTFMPGPGGKRVRKVSRIMDKRIARHEVGRRTVWRNLPPAYGRYWVFKD